MKFTRLCAALAIAIAVSGCRFGPAPALAQPMSVSADATIAGILAQSQGTTAVTPAEAPASRVTVSAGTTAGEAITWTALAFGSVLSTFLTKLIIRLLQNAGVRGAELLSDKLNRMIVNGLNIGAQELAADLKDKGQVEIKNAIVARAIVYAQDHAAETITKLGLDPQSGQAVEAIKARIETALADPTVPTPAIIAPAGEPAKSA